MDEPAARRMTLSLTTATILAPQVAAGKTLDPREINRAVQIASDIDKAVAKRIRWESRARQISDSAPAAAAPTEG